MGLQTRIRTTLIILVLLLNRSSGLDLQAGARSRDTRVKLRETLAIVVNRSNPIDNLSFKELRKIFLGERDHWPNGHRIVVAMLDYGQPERQTILRLVCRMQEDQYQDHLLKGVFRGEVFAAPKTLDSPLILRKFIFNAPGGIGYLRATDVDDSVKVVRIDGLLPQDKAYALQIDEEEAE
jgi:hypothetical protein